MGIFAAAGGGKSTRCWAARPRRRRRRRRAALIGERGREVREFIETELEGLARSVLVVATVGPAALERVKAAYVATAIAEYFRDRGNRVLLIIDCVTRFARAQREIGLAAGEPPTRAAVPALGLRDPAAAAGAGGQLDDRGIDHRVLHGAGRR